MPKDIDEDLIEATIRRVADASSGRPGEPASAGDIESNEGHAEASGALDATMRRMQSEKAARAAAGERAAAEAEAAASAENFDDPIEATVKRVQAEQAARAADEGTSTHGSSPDEGATSLDADSQTEAEDPIEATIRRVQAEKAARESEPVAEASQPATEPDDADDAIEATIRRVQAEKEARENVEPAPAVDPAAMAAAAIAAAEEDPIEATIRRVQADKAARETAEPEPAVDPAPLVEAEFDDPIEATVRRVQADKAARTAKGARSGTNGSPQTAPESVPAALIEQTQGQQDPIGGSRGAVERVERDLAATNAALRDLSARFEALLPLVERLIAQPTSSLAPARQPAAVDDSWDDTPRVSSMPVGLPPRPSILRDPSPMAATAEHLVEAEAEVDTEEIDVRPIPEPLPPIQAAPPKRGFDLLPRTYRITVEDKRRGVDLVPLHRALLSMEGVKDMSLLSYNNGVAIVALETTVDIEPETLGTFVSRAMSRGAKVEQHNENTMVVKLAEE